jgi:hypothetical protein
MSLLWDGPPLRAVTDPSMEKRILRIARMAASGGEITALPRNLTAVFEYGQWWLNDREQHIKWAVLYCDPGEFCFHQITAE